MFLIDKSLKIKININNKAYMYALLLIFIWVIISTVLFMHGILFPDKNIVDLINEKKHTNFLTKISLIRLYTYITLSLFLMVYVLNVSLSRRKIEIGYAFLIIWPIIFCILLLVPMLSANSFSSSLKIILNIMSIMVYISLLIMHIKFGSRIFVMRKYKKYEYLLSK